MGMCDREHALSRTEEALAEGGDANMEIEERIAQLRARAQELASVDEEAANELESAEASIPVEDMESVDESGPAMVEACEEVIDEIDEGVPSGAVPIHANAMRYEWGILASSTSFDVIMMDPPWQLATNNPTRGVSLGYTQLTLGDIFGLPFHRLQTNGFLMVWVINAKYAPTLEKLGELGYRVVDEVVWVKTTPSRRYAKSHGFYLQHATETCLVGLRGDPPRRKQRPSAKRASDVIYAPRRGQSQKPGEIYELAEALAPGGRYLELFARKNNLRSGWVSLGNEVTGRGLPDSDLKALAEGSTIPHAKFGKPR